MNSLLNFFLTPAYADSATATQQGGGTSFFMMLAVFLFFIYFAMWRPQSKRAKEQRLLLDGLAKGDEVMTQAGMVGKIVKLSDQFIVVTFADDMEVVMQKNAVVNVLPKGTLKSITS